MILSDIKKHCIFLFSVPFLNSGFGMRFWPKIKKRRLMFHIHLQKKKIIIKFPETSTKLNTYFFLYRQNVLTCSEIRVA